MKKIRQIYDAISADPSLLNELTADAPVTRAMPQFAEPAGADTIRSILKEDLSDEEISELIGELNANNAVRLFKEADGTIDAKELMDYIGDLSGEKADSPSVRALFDGKLQLKEILLIILLLKLFKKKQTQQTNTGSGLLNSLLFGQQAQQQSYGNNLFSNLFSGSNTYTNGYSLYNNSYGNSSNGLLSLFGLGSQPNYNNAQNNLINFINGNNLSQSQLQSLYNQLNQNSSSAVYGNGQINVSTLFSLLSQLMTGR